MHFVDELNDSSILGRYRGIGDTVGVGYRGIGRIIFWGNLGFKTRIRILSGR